MLASDDVVKVEFEQGRGGAGYDEIEVDDFLDSLVITLRGYEQGAPRQGVVTSRSIDDVAFTRARGFGRRGYDAASVDAFLVKARETLRAYESRGGVPTQAPEVVSAPRQAPSTAQRSAVSEPKKGIFGKLFGG
ncbi:DivIVA domain-containing protein [Dermacoccus barathri]|uniref:DivIVA domain-containing protein n=1 Tax=Dermacoccus barathri TaxID=322601 RepID=UPI00187ACBAE|nr:DivIVA domain-containing protein [Dermacoccus barathri]MBE7370569.1 DivIVA domain-containing protein [Dermacoccus barathri]